MKSHQKETVVERIRLDALMQIYRRGLLHKAQAWEEFSCVLVRHGGKYDWYRNPTTGISNRCRGIVKLRKA